jgi:hypothetical protein
MPIKRQAEPEMRDRADSDLHTKAGRDPYPEPKGGSKSRADPENDLADPAETDRAAPHDRGVMKDCEYLSGRDQMDVEIGKDKEAWRKGRTQNSPSKRR